MTTTPQEWKLVPVEPTLGMVHAAISNPKVDWVGQTDLPRSIYAAMLAATPTPQPEREAVLPELDPLVERLLKYTDIRVKDPRENRTALGDLFRGEIEYFACTAIAAQQKEVDRLRAQLAATTGASGAGKEGLISGSTVVSKPGAALHVERLHLTEAGQAALSVKRAEDE